MHHFNEKLAVNGKRIQSYKRMEVAHM